MIVNIIILLFKIQGYLGSFEINIVKAVDENSILSATHF
jgi:hypothetical protein